MKPMLWHKLSLLAISLLFVAAFSASSSATIYYVNVTDTLIYPQNVTVIPGDTVRWVVECDTALSCSVDTDSTSAKTWSGVPSADSNATLEVVFTDSDTPGPFPYSCACFPGMGDTIFVQALSLGIHQDNPLPKDFSLSQNFPNPFNPTTTIRFSLSKVAQVEFTVYNILGQVVEHRDLGRLPGGSYSLNWDGTSNSKTSVPSGVYYYRIKAGDLNETKKMVLLK